MTAAPALLPGWGSGAAAERPSVLVARVDGAITPVIAEHLADGLREAERDDRAAFLVELDTPGGLLESTRHIVRDFLGADVPVVVYVTPSGARAASAGAYLTLSAHVASMAPGTHIGAGTPVNAEGEKAGDKVVDDAAAFAVSIAEQRGRDTAFAERMVRDGTSVTDREALSLGVVDVVAPDRAALLDAIDGRTVTLDGDRHVVLRTAGAETVPHELGFFGELRQTLASPELAFLFLSLGTLAVVYEFATPGMGLAGTAGVILLVLGFVALSVLPFQAGGLLLLLLAAVLFLAELFTPGIGVFAAGGTAALVMAGVLLFRGELAVDPLVLWPTALVVGAGSVLAGRLAWRARRAPAATGIQTLVDAETQVRHAGGDTGQVFLDGAWWAVRSASGRPLTEGGRVRVTSQDGLVLIVEPLPEEES
ncbi:nodulation protein NfeD [Streptomyces sp. R302]|uniref:NfeD family protein n=1 Tax=unclassified Streptomyces TaxID=2593676 RepID=UPI00145D3924|nr:MULTISPECIES: nodulation protein NfeD [unclassified Streptomyces]NML49238.1 nodulation protein NfeD [Streptomyces sp. R301]NML77565.1 nodulation protein NfeD [Streptomyces sp. R302]